MENPPGLQEWPIEYRSAFDEHLDIAKDAFADILGELELSEGLPEQLQGLRAAIIERRDSSPAFQNHALPVEGAFGTSFINFFNYQHGFLAPHRDRCLVTIVYTLIHVRTSDLITSATLSCCLHFVFPSHPTFPLF